MRDGTTMHEIGKPQLRSFGLIVGAGFGIIALWPTVWRGQSPRMWALVLSLALAGLALVAPRVLGPVHRVWMTVGEALGWLNTRIILGIVYYLLIVPTGMIRRILGRDPMRLKFDREAVTYRAARGRRPDSHMRRQY